VSKAMSSVISWVRLDSANHECENDTGQARSVLRELRWCPKGIRPYPRIHATSQILNIWLNIKELNHTEKWRQQNSKQQIVFMFTSSSLYHFLKHRKWPARPILWAEKPLFKFQI